MLKQPMGRRAAVAGLVMLALLSVPLTPPHRVSAAAALPGSERTGPGPSAAAVPADLDASEKAVLAELFALNRAQEDARAQIERLAGEVSQAESEQAAAAAQRDALEERRQQQLERFGRRLRYYHEESALAPIAFVLASQSFTEFLRRVEIWTEILASDARLVAELRQLKSAVAAQEQALAEKQASLSALLRQSEDQSAKLTAEIAQKEAILAGLRSRRAEVEAQLALLEQNWETKARPVLMSLGSSLQTVSLADFQPDSMKASLFPPALEARFSEGSLNRLLQSKADLKGLTVKVVNERVNLEGEFDGVQLQISGHFALSGQNQLRYAPDAITVDAIPVPDTVTAQLLSTGQLDIDMSAILGSWSLKDVHMEGQELVVKAGAK